MRVRSISGSFEGGCGEGGQDGWPSGETAGDKAGGDFLGGTRSPRPRCKAVRKPRHNMIIRGKGTPGGLMGTCPGSSRRLPYGRAEPAPPGGLARVKGFAVKTRGQRGGRCSRRDAVSASERQGWTQARACHDYGRAGVRKVGGLTGRSSGGSKAPLGGVRSPPLRGGAKPRGRGLTGKCRR